jgi:replicative DNA helicase
MNSGIEALRISPHSLEAEQAVLGGLLLAPEALVRIADWLAEDDFYRKDHRLIWRAITLLAARREPIDTITLGEWFDTNDLGDEGMSSYLVELANATPSAANIVAHAEIVLERSRLRQLIDIGTALTEEAYSPRNESSAALATAMHKLAALQTSRLRGGLQPVRDAMSRVYTTMVERFEQASLKADEKPLLGHPWPWRDLNNCTKGLRDGVLYVVGARPNMGKSVFGLQAALFNALRGENVAVFSVEMTTEECLRRALAAAAMVPHDWVESPSPYDPDGEMHWSRIPTAVSGIIDAPIMIDDTPGLTIDQLMARARRAHMRKKLRLVVVDHMHDMGISDKREARFEYGRICQGAKTLAKELNCPVILMAQLNRGSAQRADKRPTMTDLRESGEIEQKADVILFLHREDYYDPKKKRGIVEVILAKGRNIKTGEVVELENCFSQMRLKDHAEGYDYTEEGPIDISRYIPNGFRG